MSCYCKKNKIMIRLMYSWREVMDETKIYKTEKFKYALIEETLNDVMEILQERGYNPINQIVGYLMSGDLGYISNHKEARNKIRQFERAEIIEYLVNNCKS